MDFERDIVDYELLLVMDKFTAADVLREVSVYDTISKAGRYTSKVRALGGSGGGPLGLWGGGSLGLRDRRLWSCQSWLSVWVPWAPVHRYF